MKILRWLIPLLTWLFFYLCGDPAFASCIPSIPYNLTNGTLADATQVMGNFNTIVTDVNANCATAGANSNITSITGLTTPLANTYGGTVVYTGGTTGGSANAQTLVSVLPNNFALTVGNIITAIAGFTNTGIATLNVNSQGVIAMRIETVTGLNSLVGGEIVVGQSYTWLYDGSFFVLLNPSAMANNQLAKMAADTIKGNPTSSSAVPTDIILTSSQFLGRAGSGNVQGYQVVVTLNKQVFSSSGTYTPTTGMLYAIVEAVGAGGGGGGSSSSAVPGAAGGGGGYSKAMLTAATLGTSQTITVGSGGVAGAAAGGNGGNGGVSSIGSIVVANGGNGGGGNSGAAGSGGTATGGDINITGQMGLLGSQAGNGTSGEGGSTVYGLGGIPAVGGQAGNKGTGYGAAGSGGVSSGSNQAGAAGTQGIVYITEFVAQ